MKRSSTYRVAIGSLGTVGLAVARRIDDGIPGLELAAVSARDRARAEQRMQDFQHPAPVVPLAELAGRADVVVESAPASVFREVVEPAVQAGRIVVPISVGALLEHWDLVNLAAQTGAKIIVPSGALLGLDAVRAAALDGIHSVRIVTRKPPGGLAGAPHLIANDISVEGLDAPLKVFAGTAREGAIGFPANVNVAAALALAGTGPDNTELEIWADPEVTRNTHRIEVEGEVARFTMTIEGVPTHENPRTGRIVAPSVIATLRRLVDPLTVGT